jgi:L-lactate dehydrogenase
MIQKRTIGIVGTGHVGVAAAYAVFLRGLCSEIVLIDKDRERAEGEAMDLMHGQAFAQRVAVRAGGYRDLANAQLVVITAGVSQKEGETRLDLLNRNAEVFQDIIGELDRQAPKAVLIIATNPVDVLTHVSQTLSHRPGAQIFGTGTMLDTARFRALLGRHYDVDPRSVHAYIVGEHGDSEVPLWSSARIGGVPLVNQTISGRSFDREGMDALFERVRNAAYEIISRKGYTNTAIGSAIARLVEAVLEDQGSVLPVSRLLEGQCGIRNVCLSIPTIMGSSGVREALLPRLSDDELAGLQHSAGVLKKSLRELNL